MEVKTGTWFECKAKYEKMGDDGCLRTSSEPISVDAVNWAEAEAKTYEYFTDLTSGTLDIVEIKIAQYADVILSDGDKFFKVKVAIISVNDKGKEKRSSVTYLVRSTSLNASIKVVDEYLGKTMIDYLSVNAQETNILDIVCDE